MQRSHLLKLHTSYVEGHGALSVVAYAAEHPLCIRVNSALPKCCCCGKGKSWWQPHTRTTARGICYICVEPVYNFFRSKFENDLKSVLVAFKAACYFSPVKFYELQPTVVDIDCLRVFSLLDLQPIIDGLKAKLPAYLAAAEDVSTEIDPVAWWKRHTTELPKWAEAFRSILLVQSSSAAAERVFSILQGFTAQQQSSLEDYVELSVMLQYNSHSVHCDDSVHVTV